MKSLQPSWLQAFCFLEVTINHSYDIFGQKKKRRGSAFFISVKSFLDVMVEGKKSSESGLFCCLGIYCGYCFRWCATGFVFTMAQSSCKRYRIKLWFPTRLLRHFQVSQFPHSSA